MLQRKFNPGTYHWGMWSSFLEQDISWYILSNETSIGRPRKGPSWSWTQSGRSCNDISFVRFHQDNYYQLHEIIDPDIGQSALDYTALLLSGTIITVVLRTYEQRDEMESTWLLMRSCHVFELEEQCSPNQDGNTLNTMIRYSPLPGSASDPLSEADAETYESTMTGAFMADYRFWESEKELQHELHHVVFLLLGIEDFDDFLGQTEETHCWVAGMVLRAVETRDTGPLSHNLDRYERVGWLRYCTNKTRGEYTLGGSKTKFLII
jgi:hypothetical protein